MSSFRVFVGVVTIDIPVHLKRRSQSYTASWLIDTALKMLCARQRRICSSIVVLDMKTKCCGLSILPHTKLSHLLCDDHLPDLELFVSIDTLLPLSWWQKLLHLGFDVTNKRIQTNQCADGDDAADASKAASPDDETTEDDDDAASAIGCEICGAFDENTVCILVDLTNTAIFGKCDPEMAERLRAAHSDEEAFDFEAVKVSRVSITGNFNAWRCWEPLRAKRIKHIQHWTRTVELPIKTEFRWDISCHVDADDANASETELEPEHPSKVGGIAASSDLRRAPVLEPRTVLLVQTGMQPSMRGALALSHTGSPRCVPTLGEWRWKRCRPPRKHGACLFA